MKWTIFFIDSSPSRPARFQTGWLLFGCACLALLAGVIGWGRMTFMAILAFHCQRTLSNYRADSTSIHTRLAFLNTQLDSHRLKLKQLSDYEKTLRLSYGLKAIPDDVRMAGVGGLPSAEERTAVAFGDPMVKKVFDLEEGMTALLRQVAFEESLLTESAGYIGKRHEQWAQTPSIRPAEGRLASRFGLRTDPMGGGYDAHFHKGIDLANSIGTPVCAAADGIVRFTGVQGGFGTVVRVEHEAAGIETVYAHLESYCVKEGQKVYRGERIGLMGNSGRSTGPHLHYEVRKSGKSFNPQSFILPESLVVD
jgi:murein DD-endopeptidase MepM/ murein hydrolase activator NlpD